MDHVRCAAEHDTVPEQSLIGLVDITGAEVDNRIAFWSTFGTAGEEQSRAAAVEEREK